ncbi:transmembrane amino acid transporter protein-domain-containing protein [Aspergillus germanicus]
MSKISDKQSNDPEALGNVTSQQGDVQASASTAHDAVFGEITEDGPNYRNLGFWATCVLMMKTQFGMGVLSIPATFDTLGIIPGVICLLTVGVVTTWSIHIIGAFKRRHPEIYSIDDAGFKMFGVAGREILGFAYCIMWIFVSASRMLSISIALNVITSHGACTAIFVSLAAIVGFVLSSVRTLGRMTWLAWVALTSILTAILALTIAVGIQDRPDAAPQSGPWSSDWKLTNNPSFPDAVSAVASQLFAYGGVPGFFAIVAEMRDPKQYTRAMAVCQGVVSVFYLGIGVIVYYFCGSYVSSPALGSAGALMKKVCYGLALPSLVFSVLLLTHMPAKWLFIRLLRDTPQLTSNNPTHWLTWLACTFFANITAYVIVSGIPIFNSLISLVSALLGTLLCLQPMGCMWLYDNWGPRERKRDLRWRVGVACAVFVICAGTFIMGLGTYGRVRGIVDAYHSEGVVEVGRQGSLRG